MYFSLNWLKELVEIPNNITHEELASKLTLHTVEVEDIKSESERFKSIVVGEIVSIEKHPNADRLQLTEINVGQDENLKIVCGALNIEKGQKVPVALVGAILPNGLEIREAEVRGEKSVGMLCAEDELGIGDDHAGIMILSKNAKIGQNLAEYLKLKDVIIEVDNKSLTNRPDLLNHLGLAREIATFLNVKLTKEFYKITEDRSIKIPEDVKKLNIEVSDFDLCPRYTALKFGNVEIGDSPKWLQERLSAIGVRPINNIVDITNYVMLKIGQPMHAFDSDLVDKIVVRKAKSGESIVTLDGDKKELDTDMLVIADSEKPIAIAGVMGGEDSGVGQDTKTIIFESANFEGIGIRKTSKKLGLRTEASIRYEKALDPNLTQTAIVLIYGLMKMICPKAKIASNLADISLKTKEGNFGLNVGPIDISIEWLQKRIGKKITSKEIIQILEKLFFEVQLDDDILSVKIPTWRATKDVSIKEDILEEVARIYGYENITEKKPKIGLKSPRINKKRNLERKVKNILSTGLAMNENCNYSFTNEDKIKKMNIDLSGYIKLANPISVNHTLLRQSLIVNLLGNIKTNQAKYNRIEFFEIGSVFMDFDGTVKKDNYSNETLPYQETRLGLVCGDSKNGDIFDELKGKIEHLFGCFSLSIDFDVLETVPNWSDEKVCASINVNGQDIGIVAKPNKKVLQNLGIKKSVVVAEIIFDKFLDLTLLKKNILHKEQNKFPVVSRDLAFILPMKVLYNSIRNEILEFDEIIESVELFDSYIGDKIDKNKKSLAFHIIYRSLKGTLTAKEIDIIQDKLIKKMEDKYGAVIRDF